MLARNCKALTIAAVLAFSTTAHSQDRMEIIKFQEIFKTAGYATIFGAALGAAVLGLRKDEKNKLRYITVGASIGFITGSVLGTYLAIAPNFWGGAGYHSDAGRGPLEIALAPTLDSNGMGVAAHLRVTGW